MKIKDLSCAGILFLLILGCGETTPTDFNQIEAEISELSTDEAHRDYLENIFKADQETRQGQDSEILLRHGKDSNAYREFVRHSIRQDSINLVKIKSYLHYHGHPQKAAVGELAAQTPWAVIHHAASYAEREKLFGLLYQAFLNGDIGDSAITMYLGRMYQKRYGERFQMESPYTTEAEIKQLMEALGLEHDTPG